MNKLLTIAALVLLGAGAAACDTYEQDEYTPEVVVESYLVAGKPLPKVRLSTTAPFHGYYSFEEYAIQGATVTVYLLGESGSREQAFTYSMQAKGIYTADDTVTPVQPLRGYEIVVQAPGHGEVRASTLVPGDFNAELLGPSTVVYQDTTQVEGLFTRSVYPGRDAFYNITIAALDTTQDLVPVFEGYLDLDDDLSRRDFALNSSGILSESSFDEREDGKLVLPLPWFAIAFYGPNRIYANALDDNLYDWQRSAMGGGTQSPGEADNRIDHVENGRGIFGSIARDSLDIVLQKR